MNDIWNDVVGKSESAGLLIEQRATSNEQRRRETETVACAHGNCSLVAESLLLTLEARTRKNLLIYQFGVCMNREAHCQAHPTQSTDRSRKPQSRDAAYKKRKGRPYICFSLFVIGGVKGSTFLLISRFVFLTARARVHAQRICLFLT